MIKAKFWLTDLQMKRILCFGDFDKVVSDAIDKYKTGTFKKTITTTQKCKTIPCEINLPDKQYKWLKKQPGGRSRVLRGIIESYLVYKYLTEKDTTILNRYLWW